jgi:hypothetical protein
VILDQTPLAPDLQKTVKPPRVRFNPVVLILDAPCGLERSLQLWPARKRIAFGALNLNEAKGGERGLLALRHVRAEYCEQRAD